MADAHNLARHLRQCCERGQPPRLEAADAKLWYLALGLLMRRGALEASTFAALHLRATFPDSAFIAQSAMLLERMPPAVPDPDFAQFADDLTREVQIVRRAGATTVLVAFCGRYGSLGMPLPVAHRWFGPLGVHVVYLRNLSDVLYDSGVASLAADRAGTVRALEAIARGLGTSRTVCYGNSTGGYGALLYGLDLRSAAVLALNATLASPAWAASRIRSHPSPAGPANDLRDLYNAASRRPLARILYSAENRDDAESAATMAGVPGVTIEAVAGSEGHDAHVALIEGGRFGALLHRFVAAPGEPDLGGPEA